MSKLLQEGSLGVIDDFAHNTFDDLRAITVHEAFEASFGGVIAGDLRPQVQSHKVWLARGAEIDRFDIPAQRTVLDDFHGGIYALVKGVTGIWSRSCQG